MMFFDYFFYRNYWWDIKIIKNKDYPIFASIVGVSFFQVMNVFFIKSFIQFQLLDRKDVLDNEQNLLGIIIVAIILVANYIYFNKSKRYKNIINKYRLWNSNRKYIYDILSVFYIIVTFISTIMIAYSVRNNIHWW